MLTDQIAFIQIKPQSKRHHLFILVLGAVLLMFNFVLNAYFWQEYRLPLMVMMFACCILLFVGFSKYTEPNTSYRLTRENIHFIHRHGQWQLPWIDVIRIGTLNTVVGNEYTQLPYLGIRLKSLDNIADSISPRLANRLIHEQQELLVLAAHNKDVILENGLINFSPFQLNKKLYKGPIAGWLYRTEQLASIYGYHLFLPISGFDRELDEFLLLLNQCKNHAQVTVPPVNDDF